ncbi:hypothetical protein GCM10023336_01460 [Streptomyces similanensis]|uniref:HTH araC/xylS-type domain-containing protein n=1 Tax=Streptomyces similanensis TaxID=1274988 RepID=A0ABP9JS47_9ACTN
MSSASITTVLPASTSLLVEQAGRRTLATPGSLVIYDSAEPFSLSAKEYYEQVVLELPADKAFSLAGVSRSDDLLARTFDCGGATGAVAAFFVHLAQRQDGDRLGAHRLEPQATALGASLIGLLAPGQGVMPESLRRAEALAYMRAHLADPDLDAEGIAAGLHVSRRTLFRLFEGTGESAMARLRSLRLERARLMLRTHPGRHDRAGDGFLQRGAVLPRLPHGDRHDPQRVQGGRGHGGAGCCGRPGPGDMTCPGGTLVSASPGIRGSRLGTARLPVPRSAAGVPAGLGGCEGTSISGRAEGRGPGRCRGRWRCAAGRRGGRRRAAG